MPDPCTCLTHAHAWHMPNTCRTQVRAERVLNAFARGPAQCVICGLNGAGVAAYLVMACIGMADIVMTIQAITVWVITLQDMTIWAITVYATTT